MALLSLMTAAVFANAVALADAPARPRTISLTDPTGDAVQLVLVIGNRPGKNASAWDVRSGTMQRFEREGPGIGWTPVGDKVRIDFGKYGMAWGVGLHGQALGKGPIKKEGDLRSPVGVFRLTGSFGFAPEAPSGGGSPMPGEVQKTYTQLTENIRCVEDQGSKDYNQILDHSKIPGAKPKGDFMGDKKTRGKLFKWGVVVDHNPNGTMKGAGSCVFIHIWRNPDLGSAGCTVSTEFDIEELTGWLQPGKGAVMVQLPYTEYLEKRGGWALP